MRAVVVYESMYGNTHAVADAVRQGIAEAMEVDVLPVVDADDLRGVDLLVLGAPTHVWGMSRPTTRRGAADAAAEPGSGLVVEPGAAGAGMREWLAAMPPTSARIAVFDTRMRGPFGLSGSAAKRIARHMRHAGHQLVDRPQGFDVSTENELMDGEIDRARAWGAQLASKCVASAPS